MTKAKRERRAQVIAYLANLFEKTGKPYTCAAAATDAIGPDVRACAAELGINPGHLGNRVADELQKRWEAATLYEPETVPIAP